MEHKLESWEQIHKEYRKPINRIKYLLRCFKDLGVIWTIKYKLGLAKEGKDFI